MDFIRSMQIHFTSNNCSPEISQLFFVHQFFLLVCPMSHCQCNRYKKNYLFLSGLFSLFICKSPFQLNFCCCFRKDFKFHSFSFGSIWFIFYGIVLMCNSAGFSNICIKIPHFLRAFNSMHTKFVFYAYKA